MEIVLKRIYEEPSPNDGYRVLVDRIWPRGITKQQALLDEWYKNVAPSTALRKWFHHDPQLWEEFSSKYWAELDHDSTGKTFYEHLKNQEKVTLLYAAKDQQHCHPLVLKEYIARLKND